MFASAYIIGPDDGPGLALEQLCLDMNFRNVFWLSNLLDAEEQTKKTPLCIFFFTSALDPKITSRITKQIRGSRNRLVKFAPAICLCEEPTEQVIRQYINAGFDDILIPPFHAGLVLERIKSLIGRRVTFFETEQYFGPDRRRDTGIRDPGHKMRGTGGDHRRIEVVRDVNVGVKILRDQQIKEISTQLDRRAITF